MTNIKVPVVEIPLEELSQPTGNSEFQKEEDFAIQLFLAADYSRIRGEVRIYHRSEISELIRHINELKK